jgi:methionine synthase / methylenetetrahydrofolate reductase(NADPH)
MDARALNSLLTQGPLLADGGMGTSLVELGAPVDSCFEMLNLDRPDLVERVHAGFVGSGSRLILTNTFGANRYRLERFGASHRVAELCAAAVERARSSGAEVVGGSMGPLGIRLAPYGRVRDEDAFAAYQEQASALSSSGVDLLVIETQTDLREMEQALAACRLSAPDLAVVVSATYTKDDRTLLGSTPEQVAERLVELGVDAIGVNCGEGPAQVLRVVRATIPYAAGLPVVARPNAGGPAEIGGRFVYPATPAYVGELARSLLDEGVGIVGGCCGTGPSHTREIAKAVANHAAGAREEASLDIDQPLTTSVGAMRSAARVEAGAFGELVSLEQRFARGEFVVTVEMEPPRSFSAATLVAAAGTLRDAGAHVIDVADSPMAKMRMSAWAACHLIQEQVGIETVLHFPTRGRNLLRLQGDLLGAHALGIRNLFVCAGDPVTIGDYPHGSDNIDVTATGLLALVTSGFNVGRDRAGSSIGEPTSFYAGAAASPSADLVHEARLMRKKIDMGASFFLTQPVFEAEAIGRLLDAYSRHNGVAIEVPVLVGVLPLMTSRHAEFLHNEVPGISIPDHVRDRMRAAGDDAWKEGLSIARELVDELRGRGAAGIYVIPQFGRFDVAAELVESAVAPASAPS